MSKFKSSEKVDFSDDSDREDTEVEYVAPRGFKKTEFEGVDLDGKQIWVIKTNKNFKFDELNELKLGKTIEVEGVKYTVEEDELTGKENYQIFNKGKFLKSSDIKLINLVEKVEIPDINLAKCVEPRKDVMVIDGLKTQHYATGYGGGDNTKAAEEPPAKKQKKDKKDKKSKKKQ